MWWYIFMDILFSLYILDLMVHFIAAMIGKMYWWIWPQITTKACQAARSAQKQAKQQQKRRGGASSGGSSSVPSKQVGRNADMEMGIVVDTRQENGGQLKAVDTARAQRVSESGPADFTHLTALYGGEFPKVLIQVPMYNEEAHCELIIERCCSVAWPAHRKLVQVCDDSTNQKVYQRVVECCQRMQELGHNVQLVRRDNRSGYKAGAMVEGLERIKGQGFEFVAVFDADFEPPIDFLYQTVIYMCKDPKVGFVQTRWTFRHVSTMLTWAQMINLNFHFSVEQRSRAFMGWFFNFNGTAGVWRIHTIEDAGGWESDTVVEDMDLSLRAYLRGWTTVYVHDVHCINELPASMDNYRTQQFRWLSGPMQIVRKSFGNIWRSDISFAYKMNAYWFFLRYTLFVGVTLVSLIAPPVILWLDEWKWEWYCIWFIIVANWAVIVYLYFSIFSVAYMIFSVVTGYFKLWAMLSGLLGLKKSKTWKVTLKTANNSSFLMRLYHAPYLTELVLFLYYCVMTAFCVWYGVWALGAYTGVMSVAFLAAAFGDYLL